MSKHIVVIEDDPDLAQAFRDFVEGADFTVQTPMSFAEAVAVLQGGEYDLVIADHRLTGWQDDGHGHRDEELHPYIRAGVPVLFMSAGNTAMLKAHHLVGHPCDHITKPFSLDDLYAKIRALLSMAARAA